MPSTFWWMLSTPARQTMTLTEKWSFKDRQAWGYHKKQQEYHARLAFRLRDLASYHAKRVSEQHADFAEEICNKYRHLEKS